MKHKHAELIKAWADGAEIQYKNSLGLWTEFMNNYTLWNENDEYRIKPEIKPDIVRRLNQLKPQKECNKCWEESDYQITKNCIEITFDGETGELESAEILK